MISLFLALATITVTPTPQVSEIPPKAPDEIQKIREAVQQKVKEKLKLIIQPSTVTKGIIGKIIQTDPTQFTLEYQGTTQVVKYDDNTVFIDANRNKSKADKFKIGQEILAMGSFDVSSNELTAKRIVGITLTSVIGQPRVVVIGKIVDISKSSPVFSLVPTKNKNTQYQIKTDSKTEILDSNDKKLSVSDLKSGQKIITILTPDAKMAKTYYAKKIINLDYISTISPTPTKKP